MAKPRFVNLWDAGLSADLVVLVAKAIDASGEDGADRRNRFVTVREDKTAPVTVGEQRLVLPAERGKGKNQDPLRLVRRLREAAATIGVFAFYVPKGTRGGLLIGLEDARWLRAKGHTSQAIGDLWGVSKYSARAAVGSVVDKMSDTARAQWEAKAAAICERNTGSKFSEEDFRVGADWLRGRRLAGDPVTAEPREVDELTELLGPARIARVGAALRDLRAAKRPDPPAAT